MSSIPAYIHKIARNSAFAGVIVITAVMAQPAKAQGVFDMGALTGTLSVDHVTQSERARSSNIKSADISQLTMRRLQQSAAANHKPAETSYAVSKSARVANLQQIVKKTAVQDATGAKMMEQLFANTDVIAEIGRGIAPYGLKIDNVADAYTVYWMTAWQAAHKDNSSFEPSAVAAVRLQAADIFMQTSAFVDADDSIKQELAEIYLVQAALIQAVADEAVSNPSLQSDLASAVRKGGNASGLDLDKMTLTEEGFREGGPRKRSDASEATESEKALAANDTRSDGDGATNYALIAAAAGAGLGGVFLLGKAMGRKG
jgi:hypothetical protein